MTDPLDQVVNVNFRMTERDRRALEAWCAEQGLTLTEGFHEGVALLRGVRDQFGPDPFGTLLETIATAESYLVDAEREIRVEWREGAWVVREGPLSVVNQDGALEHAGKANVERTWFGLQEAFRIARVRAGAG